MGKALIVCGGWDGHQPVATSEIVADLLRPEGMEVEIASTLDVFLDEDRLRTFDLIVPNWTMGDMSKEQEAALARTIEVGTGLGGFHGGMGDAFRSRILFQFMVGGQFVSHPDDKRTYEVHLTRPDDPIVAGLADFTIHSEQYYMHVDPANEVLATTVFQTKSAPWINGTAMPVVWKRRHGEGRVFYSSIGHGPAEFEIAEVREITRRGLLWAARNGPQLF